MHPFIPVLSPSFLYHPYIPSFKSKDFSFTCILSTTVLSDNIGTVHTVHVRMRGNYVKRLYTRHYLYPLPFAKQARGEAVETAESGRCVYPIASAELDIHVVRRRERLATETTEETDTPVPALCSIHAYLFLAIRPLQVAYRFLVRDFSSQDAGGRV